ncbi:nuclease-related domain-containing protein [Pelotomaculum propionicicum]|uniref:nuclease-related domain-containing protein n=1 Tax=Pelotomaculum propionicicum TaxID=258475 RepID=UPI003B7C4D2A
MAQTLRWPESLKKKADSMESKYSDSQVAKSIFFLFLALSVMFNIVWYIAWPGLIALAVWYIKTPKPTDKDKVDIKAYRSGYEGELIVARRLAEFPDGWFVVNDISIYGSQIDHVVVGPGGIFCLETKNHIDIMCRNGNWFKKKNGSWWTMNSPSKQNLGHVLSLKEFLYDKFKIRPKIASIIVLSREEGLKDIDSYIVPPGNTRIMFPHELFYRGGRSVMTVKDAEAIAVAIFEANQEGSAKAA